MTAIWLIKNSLLWYILMLVALILVIGGLVVLVVAFRDRRSKRTILPVGLGAALSFILFLILMDCARFAYLSEPDPRYQAFQLKLFEMPWELYAGLEAAIALLTILLIRDVLRIRGSHLTPDAIRETVDLLPEGICINAEDGTVLLANLQMSILCRMITGSVLSNAARFWQRIEANGENRNGDIYVQTSDGRVWSFSINQLTENGRTYDRITAVDMTAQFRVTEELRQKNERLREVQHRMKAVSDLSGDMFIAREEAVARAALHNQLGQILLMGRHYLEHPENTDADMVRTATLEMNRFLLREAEVPSEPVSLIQGEDLLLQALDMMKSIGVEAEICGELPADPARRILLAHAVQECAANTVKHAEGNQLCIHITDHGQTIQITNNGKPPQGTIAESGGLLSLRMSVEEAGGCMIVESATGFSLTIRFPE